MAIFEYLEGWYTHIASTPLQATSRRSGRKLSTALSRSISRTIDLLKSGQTCALNE